MPRPRETLTVLWRGVTCRVEHVLDWRNAGWSKLIVSVVHPRGAPLPFAETGYHEHQLDEDELASAGGASAYVLAWLERDAQNPRYAIALAKWNQHDLFR